MDESRAGERYRWRLLPQNSALGWTPYAWLVYLPTFLMHPITDQQAGQHVNWPLTVAGVLVFLVSYFYGFWARGRQLLAVIALQTILAIAFAPINIGAFVFFIYAGSFAAQLEERRAWTAVGTIVAAAAATALITDAPPFFWVGGVGITLVISAVNIHFARYGRTQHKLRLAEGEIKHLAATAERERIARDLHDVLGHTLSLIVLKSELASKLTERDPQRAAQEIADVEAVARKALHDVRETIRGIRPSLSDELVRAQSLLKAAGVATSVDHQPLQLDKAGEETLAYLVREAATNVARHARATRCTINVSQQNGSALLEVRDDGEGDVVSEGNGMRGMRERVEALGGSMRYSIESGVALRIELPATSS
jgi:two-component system, NarL family, sensor histidine kinase DesK